ncbi:hypothetical protein AAMO2058_001730400, partial [Amorphochlora amoebiformis]
MAGKVGDVPVILERAGVLLFAYICGYLHWPLLLVIFSVLWHVYLSNITEEKITIDRDRLAEEIWRDHEVLERFLLPTFPGIPKWVRNPWFDKADFLNDFLKVTWPYVNNGVGSLLLNKLGKILTKRKPSFLSELCLKNLDFGETPPQVEGVKFFRHKEGSGAVDVNFMFVADKHQNVSIRVRGGGISFLAL